MGRQTTVCARPLVCSPSMVLGKVSTFASLFMIGDSVATLKIRTIEHARVIANKDKNSLLAQHQLEQNHDIDINNAEVIDHCSQWKQRLFLEAWHSVRSMNSINEHVYFPEVYKNLQDF